MYLGIDGTYGTMRANEVAGRSGRQGDGANSIWRVAYEYDFHR